MLRGGVSFAPFAVVLACGCGSSSSSGVSADASPPDAGTSPDGSTADGATDDGPSFDGPSGADATDAGSSTCSLPPEGGTGPHGLTQLYAPSTFGAFLDHGALAGGYVYFTEDGDIKRVPTAGGAVDDFGQLSAGPFLVVGNDLVYSTGPSSGMGWSIVKAALGTDAAAGTVLAQNIAYVGPMASDGTYVAWSNANSPGVYSVPLAGGPVSTITAGGRTGGLAVIGSTLYWADLSTMHVMFAPIAGGTPMQGAAAMFDGEAAADSTAFYWTDFALGDINRMPVGSTTAQAIYMTSSFGDGPEHIAVSGSSVYFTGNLTGNVWRVGTDGTSPAQLACGYASTSAVFADATYVYYLSDSGVFRVDQ
jgi:hypothetical protein